MSEDVLKKPVHVALLRPTQLDKLAAEHKIEATPFGIDPNVKSPPLPVEQKDKPYRTSIPKAANYMKAAKKQIQLKVLHDSVPAIPEDKQPPCETCKTAACCYVFVVNITEVEYESGVYGDAAVKITPEIFDQLHSRFVLPQMVTAPRQISKDKPSYYLEGKIGEPCPFLTAEKKCGIYEYRPRTCRAYTCVGDPRITEGMRQGTESLEPGDVLMRNKGPGGVKEPGDAK